MEVKAIRWRPTARTKFQETIRWYLTFIGKNAAQKFTTGINKDISLLSRQPYIGVKEPLLADQQKEFRSLISLHTKIIYLVEEECIYIIDLWNCRQNTH